MSALPFLSTPSARRATDALPTLSTAWMISIHALREEGDLVCLSCPLYALLFLSTPSARRATNTFWGKANKHRISIHALREEGDRAYSTHSKGHPISIHALREEGDVPPRASFSSSFYFYPRPPRGGRRFVLHGADVLQLISIHALREEGDSKNRDKISIFKQIVQHSARI